MKKSTKDKLIIVGIIVAIAVFFSGAFVGYNKLVELSENMQNIEANGNTEEEKEEQELPSEDVLQSNEQVKESIKQVSDESNKDGDKVEEKEQEQLIKIEEKEPNLKKEEKEPSQEEQNLIKKEEVKVDSEKVDIKIEEEEPESEIVDFTVYDAEGNEVKLSDMSGKKVVVNFWATWCTYCIKEMPDFENAYIANKDDICFMMINCDSGNNAIAKVQKFMEGKEYSFPIYFDIINDATTKFNVTAFPMTLTFDEEGNLVNKHIGMLTATKLNALIEELNKVEEE